MKNWHTGLQRAGNTHGKQNVFSKSLITLMLLAMSSMAWAEPQVLDWDMETWTPEGPTNLSETVTIGGHIIPVTFSGNTAFLDNTGSPISPAINAQNTGGLSPVQNSLYVGTDYGNNTPAQVTVTLDFSDFPGGVGNISVSLFDIDSNGNSYVDEAEVTATNASGPINPTSLIPSVANAVIDANSIQGTATSNSGLSNANATFVFAQTGITSLVITYKNNGPNVGFQWMNIHDFSFDAPQADIMVEKSVDNLTPNVGENVTFTITATNNGPDAVTSVNVLDQLPSGLTYVSDNGLGAYNSTTGIWDAGAFADAQVKSLTITATVEPTGSYANTAALDSLTADDLVAANNQETVTLTPVPVADLSVTKTVDDSEPAVGSTVTFTVGVTNDGPSNATGVQVTDLLPNGYGSVVGSTATGTYASGTGIWNVGNLAVSNSASLTITATVLANGTYDNVAQVTASDQADNDSTPGNNVEAEDDQQTVSVTPPEIGVAKTISAGPVNNGDGTFSLTYTIAVENTGNTSLNALQVTDSLATTFSGALYAVNSVNSAQFATNGGFDGNGNINLLAGTDTLAIGANGTIDVALTVTPGANPGPYNNIATGSGTSPGGTGVSDVSQDGTVNDPDSDGDPTNNNAPTPVNFVEAPQIGVAKSISSGPVNNGDGTYSLTYTIGVENTGDVALNAVQVTDNLGTTFSGAAFVVNSVNSAQFAINGGYNGTTNSNLLTGADALPVGATGSIDVAVTVTPGASLGPFNNSATGSGNSPAGNGVTDVSQTGTDNDPDNDGDPGNNNQPTPVTFAEAPEIGVAKTISTGPINNGNGTYSLTYTVAVENTGDVPLSALQVTDSLATTFTGATFAINSVTSAQFSTNGGFNGNTNVNLLTAADTLLVGATGTIDIALTITPGANLGPYNNTATGSGNSPTGTGVSDDSQDGTDNDPDNDGNPNNNNDPTPVLFTESPEMGVAKTISGGPLNNGDGTYSLTYTIAVENTGDVPLNAILVSEDLAATYSGVGVVVSSVTSAQFAVNGAFNGSTDTGLLTGADTLIVGGNGSIDVAITVTPGANLGPFDNTVTGTSTSPAGTGVSDVSQNGTDTDPDNDGNPNNNSDPTPVTFAEAPQIGLAKTISTGPVNNNDGTFSLTYTIAVENTGDVPLSAVQVTDSVATAFGGATVVVNSVNSATLTVNPAYNGLGNTNLLVGSDALAAGASGSIALAITVTPGANLGPYNNTAIAAGTSPAGTGVNDASQDGTNNDPDGDGNPGNNNVPTPVTFVEVPQIGTAKTISAGPVSNGDGTHTLTFSVLVENTGDVPLNALQVSDNLNATFTGVSYVVDNVSSADFAVNSGFNGGANTNLLLATDTLAVAASGVIDFTVTVTTNGNLGPFNNTATSAGTSPAGTMVTDDSHDGTNVDPDGDGNPGNNNDPTPINFDESPEIGIAKAVSAGPVSNGDGTYSMTYTVAVENTGDVPLSTLQVTDNLAATFAGATFVVNNVTSATLTTNAGFNGGSNINLLAGSDTLAFGASATIDIVVTVTPGGNLGPYNNTANGSGMSPAGATVNDASQSGADVDPDGDGNPGNNSVPTPVTFAETPEIGLAKAVTAGPVNNGDGSYAMSYTFVVENTGDVQLNNVQVTDILAATFSGATFAVNSVTSPTLTANAAFNGTGNINLLAGSDSLTAGASGTIVVALTVTPGANLGPYDNTANAAGTSPGGTGVTDASQTGANVDPDGDGDPGNNSIPTPVSFAEAPEIGTAKTISSGPVNNGDGTYSLTYTVAVENTGDVPLNSVQLVDNLATTFAGATFVVNSVSSGSLSANAGFNGAGNSNLLTGADALAVGASGTVDVAITVTPGANLGPYNNTVTASGTSSGGTAVNDASQDGTNVDPDGDGNPGNNNDPTPVIFAETPEIGTAKALTAGPVSNGDGTFSVTYVIAVENTGDVPLNNVQVTDSLSATYAGATSFTVDSISSADFSVDVGFDGDTNDTMLTGADALAIGASGTLTVVVTVEPGANLGPYNNTATGSGTSSGGTPVSDDSQDGANVDPDGDGNPGNNNVPTTTSFMEDPEIGLAKSISAGPVNNGDGTFTLTYTLLADNTGDVPLSSLQIVDDLATTYSAATGFVVDALSSPDFATNAAFNGVGDTNLLDASDTLMPGATGAVLVTITVTPGAFQGPYNNSATATGTSPAGATPSDISQLGANVDPDGDGDPTNNNVPTPVSFNEAPSIGAAKQVSSAPVSNGDGSFTLSYSVLVENTGDVLLSDLQVAEDFDTTFAAATSYNVDSVTSADFTVDPAFNGSANSNILTGADTLAVGINGTIAITVTVFPGSNLGPYNNRVTASGLSPAGSSVSDISADGADVDPNGNGDPSDDSDPTPVSFVESPEIGTAKTVSAGPLNNGNGTYTLTYTIRLENTGDVDLNSLQISDNLATTYASAISFVVNGTSSADFAMNNGFNGSSDIDLLTGAGILAAGASGTLNVTVTVEPGASFGPYNNSATGSGISSGGTPVSDLSQDGTNVDPDSDGNPGNNSVPTPVSFAELPQIGVAKSITTGPVSNGDGTASLTYTITVENTGDVQLDNVQVVEDLATTFAGASFTVDGTSSGGLSINPLFNGTADTDLLTGSDTMAVGGSETIALVVTVNPGGNLGPYNNTATANGTSPGGAPVTDDSTDGTNVDPDGNGDPGDNSDPTPVTFNEMPLIGLAKAVSSAPVSNGDGTATFTYTFTVENAGDVELSSVQITDDLTTAFPVPTTYTVDSVTSTTLAANGAFDGAGDTNLLSGLDTLAIGASATVDVVITVAPGANLGPYNNTAIATSQSPSGTAATDTSQDGLSPDSDNDGNPGNNSDPTPVSFTEMPSVGLAKGVSSAPVNNGDGTFTLTYTLLVDNTGDVALSSLQVTDNLTTTFAGATVVVDATTSADFALNAAYDGSTDVNLLDGSDTLATNGTGTIDITLTVTPGANFGPYNNTAQVTGNSPVGTPVMDDSQSGANVDPDGDGDPGNNNVPTPVSFNETPQIGVAKQLSAGPTSNGNGTFSLAYTITAENTGDVILSALQLVENFDSTFGGATSYTVDSVTSGDFTVNAAFDGSGNTNLLDGTDALAIGASGNLVITVTVTPGANLGPYNNSVTGEGTSPGGTPVTDTSQDGADVDPDGDGDPGNNNAPTVVTFTEMPQIGLAKAVSAGPVDNGDGTSTVTYTLTVVNTGDVDLNSVQVVDDIALTFAGAAAFNVTAANSADFAINPAFNGDTVTNVLAGTDTLAAGASGTLDITVNVTAGGNLGPYNNTATANGTSPGGAPVTDVSTDGTNVDPDGDGDPSNNSDPTVINISEAPQIGTAKAVTAGPTDNGDGSSTLTYTIITSNTGTVPLGSVQITDNLAATFGTAGFTVDSVISPTLAVNSSYDGTTDTNLLTGADNIAVGAQGSVQLVITVTPGANLGPYDNTATSAGTSPAGTVVTDDSTDGANVDPDGDGNPGNNSVPTPVTFAEAPELGVSKTISSGPSDNGNGSYNLTYTIAVQNSGNTVINSLQVTDVLSSTYAAATSFAVVGVTSSSLTVNAGYDGDTDVNLLSAADSLAIGAAGSIQVAVTVVPGATLGPYDNNATATGVSPGAIVVSDVSQNGANPDPDGDGNPGNNAEPTPVNFSEAPQIGTAKALTAGPTDNGDGTSSLTYTITVENVGDVPLNALQVTDSLATTFAGADSFAVDSIVSSDFSVNASYNGAVLSNMLTGADSLATGASGTIDVSVTVTPGAFLGPYQNVATAAGTSPAGTTVSDDSTDGAITDPDGDGDPSNDNTPTPVTFTEVAQLGLAETIGSGPIDNGDGTYTLTYVVLVDNSGTVPINNLQIVDNLGTAFAGATGFMVTGITSPDLSVNPNYDGAGDSNLLTGTETLPAGANGTVEITVVVTPGANLGPYNTTATTTGTSPAGTMVSDISQTGADPDPDSDGDPGNNSDPTPVSFSEIPELGLAETIGSGPIDNGDGTHTLTYVLFVENTGSVPVSSVQIVDDLGAVFANATGVVVDGITSADLTVNTNYDGVSDTNLLDGTDTLAVGASGTVEITVTVTPGANLGPYDNTATTTGQSPAGAQVSDISQDGTDPDPDGDGDPGNNSDPTPVSFTEAPQVGVAKALSSGPDDNGNGTVSLAYSIVVSNSGSTPIDTLQLSDSLATTFAGVTAVVVDSVTSADLTVNAAYDGDADSNLLAGTDTLVVGSSGTVVIEMTVTPGSSSGPFNNTATATGASPGGVAVNDDSTDGTDIDPDADGNPGNNSDPTPVTFPVLVANLEGNAWFDANIDQTFNPGETPLEGWLIEVLLGGVVVQTVNVNPDGTYVVNGLQPGDYDIRLRNPNNMATYGLLRDVTLPPGTTLADQNLPIDPSGVVYDSDTREPIPGATVVLLGANGMPLPDDCLLPNQQTQVTDDTGYYRFDVVLDADAACASGGLFTLNVTPPTGYLDPPSLVIAPETGPLLGMNGATPFAIVPNADAPQAGDDTTYYFSFIISNGDRDIVNNHIPLDPPAGIADVRLSKVTPKKQVVIGDLVPYSLTAENIGAVALTNVTLSDMLPPGFSLVENSAVLDGPGTLTVTNNRPVNFGGIDIPLGGTTTVSYILRVGAGVTQGDYTNTATPLLGNTVIGNVATATVAVISDPDFEQTTVIGTVFGDTNGNGWQDVGEPGIPGVRLGTVEGLLVETDAFGRYHLAGLEGGRLDRGRNFIIKVDSATLPDGSMFTTENPRVQRITQGLMNSINFGVQVPSAEGACCERISVKLGEVFFADNSADIRPEFVPMLDQLADRLREHGGGRLVIAGNDAPCTAPVDDAMAMAAPQDVESYTMTPRFGVRKAELQPADKAALDRIAQQWVGASNVQILSIGHTSNVRIAPENRHEVKDNYVLSERRAQSVAQYLQQIMGLSSAQVTQVGRGPDQPVASNATASGRAKNRRVELQITGTRGQASQAGSSNATACSRDLARQRADNVLRALEKRLGKEMIKNIDVIIGQTNDKSGDRQPAQSAPGNAVSESSTMNRETLANLMRRGGTAVLSTVLGVFGTTVHAAELSNCSIDSCMTDEGYAIQITEYTDDRPLSANDSPAALANGNRVDISGEFLVRLAGGGMMWSTEDPAVVDPRMAVHAHETLPVTAGQVTQPVDFYVYKNYDAFIERAEILIFHENDIDRISPLATLPLGRGDLVKAQWDGRSNRTIEAGDQLYYVVQAFDKGGRKDSTSERPIAAIRSADYEGPVSHAIVPHQTDTSSGTLVSSAKIPMDGKMLVLQPAQMATGPGLESNSYRLTPRFDTRKTTIKESDRAELDRIIQNWRGVRNIKIFTEGHTDNIRIAPKNRVEFANNQVLSEARARAVGQYIASGLGIPLSAVQAAGYGPKRPVANNSSNEGRALNRRVELTITGDRIAQQDALIAQAGSLALLDPASHSSVPITGSLEEALNILNNKVGVARYGAGSNVSGRSSGVSCTTAQHAGHELQAVYGRNQLVKQNIPMYGSRVRIHGQNVGDNYAMTVNGNVVPVDTNSNFAVDYMLPVGQHAMNVEFMDQNCAVRNEGKMNVDVSGQHMFIVGLADFTLSDSSISGSVEPLSADDRYDGDFLVEGRLAFYLKGKIKGKYLVTAQLDTQEEEIGDLLDNLDEKDPRSIFRRLDPDRYYPVYGDDSTTIADTDSIGKMYLRADWDKSRAVWGNFHTGYTGSEFTQYNRSLYGGQFDWHSLNANSVGDSRTDLNVFVSENQAELGHSEFRGTGGSLYYLKHTDLLPGSEKLHIEVRDRDSARVLENITLVRGVDYEIDELQGRVMLSRPLMQITQLQGPNLIKDGPLDGNEVVLLADYEYIPRSFNPDHVTVGARGRHWFGDHFALGGTYVEEGRGSGAADYTLMGAEMVLQATPHTYVKVEVAETEDSQVERFFSNNGGLNFNQIGPVGNIPNRAGDALGVEARINTKEWLKTNNEWVVAGWYRNTDEGFSVARRDDGYETTESGVEIVGQLGPRMTLTARASNVDRKSPAVADDESFGVQLDYQMSQASSLAAEVRHVKDERPSQSINGTGTIGALRYTRVLNERWQAYVQGQYTIDNDDGKYDNNDMGTVGIVARLNDKANLIGEYSSGHRGDGASLSLDYEINPRHRVYGTYTHSTDRTDTLANDQIGVGHRSMLSDQLTVFNEHQFSEYRDYAGISHVFGLEFAPRPGWTFGASFQTGNLETDTGPIDRDSISGTLAYQGEKVKWSSKLERRDDSGTVSDQEQWVTSNRIDYKVSDNTRLLGRYNFSETDDAINPNYNAKFTEAQVGMAYRPAYHDRFNALAKYTYLFDLRGFDQIQTGPDQRSNVFSMEGIYRFTPRWEVGGKYAFRTGELRTDRDNGDWFESTTNFYALRGRYHLVSAWDAMAEYRWLDVEEADSTRTGWLVALDRHFGNNLKLGLGYNFTDYSDDLTNLDYDQKGWFLNAVGKY